MSESSRISRARIVRRLKTERVASLFCRSTKIKRAFSQAQGVDGFIQSSNIQGTHLNDYLTLSTASVSLPKFRDHDNLTALLNTLNASFSLSENSVVIRLRYTHKLNEKMKESRLRATFRRRVRYQEIIS